MREPCVSCVNRIGTMKNIASKFHVHPRIVLKIILPFISTFLHEFSLSFSRSFETRRARSSVTMFPWKESEFFQNDGNFTNRKSTGEMDGSIYSSSEIGYNLTRSRMKSRDTRSRTRARFNWISNVGSNFESLFRSIPGDIRTQKVGESECRWFPPDFTLAEQQSISYPGDRDRISPSISGIIEKRRDPCCHSPVPKLNSRSRRFISPSLSPTSTSKLHFPRVWPWRIASREIDSLNSNGIRSGVRVLTSLIRLPSSSRAYRVSKDKNRNELVRIVRREQAPVCRISRETRVVLCLRSRKCLHSSLDEKKKKKKSLAFPEKYPVKEINDASSLSLVFYRDLSVERFNPLRSRGDSRSPRRFDSLLTLDFLISD